MERQNNYIDDCECIFCQSKCYKCESKNVVVSYYTVSEYDNSEVHNNNINIDIFGIRVVITCKDCGYRFNGVEEEDLEKRKSIMCAIENSLNLPENIQIERMQNGTIEMKYFSSQFRNCYANKLNHTDIKK